MTELTIDMVEGSDSAKRDEKKTASKPSKKHSDEKRERTPLERLLARTTIERARLACTSSFSDGEDEQDEEDAASSQTADGTSGARRGGDRPQPRNERGRSADDELAQCLDECPSFVFHPGEDGWWEAPSFRGAKSCLIRCRAQRNGTAFVEVDSGYCVDPEHIRDANLFVMLVNGTLLVRGFSRIGADGAVKFRYTMPYDDPEKFERCLLCALASCFETMRLFSLISRGTSVGKAFDIYSEDYDELDDFEFDADFDPEPKHDDEE